MTCDLRLPPWLVKPLPDRERTRKVREAVAQHRLSTVCDAARCPNRVDCFSAGTATFMILGDRCTRGCAFCAVRHADPLPLDRTETRRVAEAARTLGLKFVVVTSVTRDDLPDGGARQFAETVREIRRALPDAGIELLVPDFGGRASSFDVVLASHPDVLGHNLETVERLYPSVRRGAQYRRSLALLSHASRSRQVRHVKSALMLGLGETREEVEGALSDLRVSGVDVVCLGQYLRPTPQHASVARFVSPEEFGELERLALSVGFSAVSSGPFVRSSYHAERMAAGLGCGPTDVGAPV